MKYPLAIFDFDGTLADSFPFFTEVFNDLARRHGFKSVAPHEAASLRRMHSREIMRHLGLPALKLPLVARDFIGLMRSRRHTISLFPGTREMLEGVRRSGIQIGIVSSNASDNVIAMLGESTAALVTHYACGVSIFGKRLPLSRVIKRSGIERSKTIYIGDQASDLEAAHAERIAFGAVSWGYGAIDHLRQSGADHLFNDRDDLARLLCAQSSAR